MSAANMFQPATRRNRLLDWARIDWVRPVPDADRVRIRYTEAWRDGDELWIETEFDRSRIRNLLDIQTDMVRIGDAVFDKAEVLDCFRAAGLLPEGI